MGVGLVWNCLECLKSQSGLCDAVRPGMRSILLQALVLKTRICSNMVAVLGNNLSVTGILHLLSQAWLHP